MIYNQIVTSTAFAILAMFALQHPRKAQDELKKNKAILNELK